MPPNLLYANFDFFYDDDDVDPVGDSIVGGTSPH